MRCFYKNPPNPFLKRWMLFVDGENFAIRAKNYAKGKDIRFTEGPFYREDVFIWLPDVPATKSIHTAGDSRLQLQDHAVRSYYYTSICGDADAITKVREQLFSLGFHPEVYKRKSKRERAKGVDIALAKDLLANAYLDNYDAAVLFSADADYIPIIQEVKRLGKNVFVVTIDNKGVNGVSDDLLLESDAHFTCGPILKQHWREHSASQTER